MLEPPEFEEEFYEEQIAKMQERYAKIFSNWKLSWDKYYNYAAFKLKNKKYWIWIFLCGFEKFLKEQSSESNGRRQRLYKDADNRIYRIIGDSYKVEEYIRSL